MIICICNNINESTIKSIIKQHQITSSDEVFNHLGCVIGCGGCLLEIDELIEQCKLEIDQ